jgi:hypothetical protein
MWHTPRSGPKEGLGCRLETGLSAGTFDARGRRVGQPLFPNPKPIGGLTGSR